MKCRANGAVHLRSDRISRRGVAWFRENAGVQTGLPPSQETMGAFDFNRAHVFRDWLRVGDQ